MAMREITGEEVLRELYELLCMRLPLLPLDDPVRKRLASIIPVLGLHLGGPNLRAV